MACKFIVYFAAKLRHFHSGDADAAPAAAPLRFGLFSHSALLWFGFRYRFCIFRYSFRSALVWFSFCLQLKRVFDWDLHLPLACVCVGGEGVCRYWDLGAKVSSLSKRILCGCE